MTRATRADWQVSMSDQREQLPLTFSLDKAEIDTVSMGVIPGDMDDRWFVYFDDGWLYFHRSWTGYEIYRVRFDSSGPRHVAREVYVTRTPQHYRPDPLDQEANLLAQLFLWLFAIEVKPL